jgi:prophage regulatory protein
MNRKEAEVQELEPLDESQRFVSSKYVARRLDVSESTVWKWARSGKLPRPTRFSPQITRWKIGDLEEWERQQRGEAV